MASSDRRTLAENLSKLRSKVEAVLADSKDGVKANSFWNDYKTKHGELPDQTKFGFAKRSDLLNCFSDLFVIVENSKGEKLMKLRIVSQTFESSSSNSPRVSKVSHSVQLDTGRSTETVGTKPVQSKSKLETKPATLIQSTNQKEVQGLLDSDNMSRKLPGNDFYGRYYGRPDAGPYQRGNQPHHVPQQGAPIPGSFVPPLLQTPASIMPAPYVQPSFNYPFQTMPQTAGWNRAASPNVAPQTKNPNINQSNNILSEEDFPVVGSASAARVSNSSGVNKNTAASARTFSPAPKPTKRMHFSREQMDTVAADCIERLSESKDYVSLERIKKLFLQHYAAESLDQLGLRNLGEFKCVNEHIRMECKVNLYIQMFVQVRAISTVYELGECLREFAPNRQDFETLRLGPLIKMPMVYEQFTAPQDKDICEIRTAEILDYLRSYLTENNLWTDNKASLEEFLKFMMNKRGLSTPYELGVRIKSLPLAIQILKKGQRDCGQAIRDAVQRLKTAVENDVDTAFRHFSSSVLVKETGLCEVRRAYLKMSHAHVFNDVFSKLKLLYQTVAEHEQSWDCLNVKLSGTMKTKRRELNKTQTTITEFKSLLSRDVLFQKFMHLAICFSHEEIHKQMSELFPQKVEDSSDDSSDESGLEAIPKKDEVVASINKYMERCIAHGNLTLEKLSKIEERLTEDFKLRHFNDLKQGGFLQFLLKTEEIKKHLDESGGTLLGSSSHGVGAESCFHASLDDLLEFVAQCAFKEQMQQKLIEMAICHHYSVKEVRSLGHGSFANLVKVTEKQQRVSRGSGVYYASALVAKNFPAVLASDRSTGPLGHKTKDQALACLQSCPLLEDMASWSHWDLVFKPELKELKDFVQKYGGAQLIPVTEGTKKKMMTTSILALEVRPGTLLRLTSDTSTEKFAEAAAARDVTGTCGHLVSLLTVNHGLEGVPLALLGNSFETALHKIRASQPNEIGAFRTRGQKDPSTDMVQFTLNCIVKVPLIIGHRVIEEVFLRPLRDIVGKVKCEEQLLAITQTMEQRSQLQVLGILLGIREWSESFQERLTAPADCVKEIDAGLTEIICVDDDSSSEVDESTSDSDFSLSEDDDEDVEEDEVEPKKVKVEVEEKQKTVATTSNKLKDDEAVETKLPAAEPDLNNERDAEHEKAGLKLDDDAENDTCMIMEPIDVDAAEDLVTAKELHCQALIDRIRQEEFGFNVELNEDGTRLLTKQQERLGRSLERLSKDLYSKDTHFVLELIQNADDNEYTEEMLRLQSDVIPSVQFHVDHDSIIVYNNEVGFQEKNIRAICDVGRTTKGKHKFGYIGQKGIGFKSVFRITDQPEIHSNGYHIRFDANSKPLGYILPQWISKDDRVVELPENWMTCIALPLKQEMQDDHHTLSLAARFRDIHPSLLLFLHRLRSIEVVNKVEDYSSEMRRIDVSDSITEIQHKDGVDRWLVVRKTLDASQISLQAKSGIEVESTEIALAFPMISKADIAAQVLPPRQPVFAFLPLRSYGFRFVVQGDFDVPSSREEVDRDSVWNQWLRNEIHSVFVNALEDFKNHPDFNEIEAVSYFLQFVPHQDEILDFFRPVATNILYQLKAKPCLPTQGLQWKLPSQLLICDDPMVREVISNSLLRKHLGLEYLHRDVAARLNPHMLQSLGVQSLTTQHLIEVGKSIVTNLSSKESDDVSGEIVKASKWLLCIYKSMDEFRANDDILASLRCLPMIPLTNGEIVSLDLQTVFFPLSTLEKDATRKNHLLRLESDMRTVHPLLLGTPENVASSQICSLLQQLGVKKLTPSEVIQHHILPALKSQDAENKPRDLLVTYMLYIKEHSSLINMDELKDIAILLTNHGPKRPNMEPVHFTEAYFNINLPRILPGYPWVLLDNCYLQGVDTKRQVHEWKEFLGRLGVTDFLAVRQKKLILKKSELAKSRWSSYDEMLPPLDEYHILDSECEEFEALVLRNGHQNSLMDQMCHLFELLDSTWDSIYKRHSMTQVTNSQNQPVKEVETSFSILLKSMEWIPSKLEGTLHLAKGCDLFVDSQDTQRLMAGHVSYIVPSVIKTSSFARYLGIQSKVDVDFVVNQLLMWSARSSAESQKPATFVTSIAHMKYIYEYLIDNLPPKRVQELFERPVIFVPAEKGNEGHFLARQEVRWFDPSGLFDRHRGSLSSLDEEINGFRVNLKLFYHGLEQVFVNVGRVQAKPNILDYVELLVQISLTSPLQRALPDVLLIFSIIGKELTDSNELEIKSQLEKAIDRIKQNKPIPSKSGRWVGLGDKTMIADDKQLERLFADKQELHFVDCGERLGIGRARVSKELENVSLDYVIKFLTSVGVERLSSRVEILSQTEMYHPCPPLQMYVHDVIPFIQRMLYCYPTIYDYLVKEKAIKSKLATMQFAQVTKLELIHTLRNVPDILPVIFPQICRLLNDQEMYIVREFVNSYNDINRELARYFSCTGIPCPDEVAQSSEACFSKLKSFLGEILPLIQSKSQALDDLMDEHNLLSFPVDEELWEVRVPLALITHPQPVLVAQADVHDAKVPAESEEMTDESGESSGLKSWPPQAPSSRAPSGFRPSTARAPLMWPPPDAPQYLGHSELPANLRPSTLEREPGQQEQLPDDGSQEKNEGQHKEQKRELRDGSHLEMSDVNKGSKHLKPKDEASGPPIKTDHVSSDTPVSKKHEQEEGGGTNPFASPKIEPQSENLEVQETVEAMVAEKNSPVEEKLGSNHPEQMVIEFSLPSTEMATAMRAGHKRARVSSGPVSNDYIRPHTKQMVTSHFYGPPIWLAQTDENVFDHLGSADGLPLPCDVTINEDSDTTAIGIWGEHLVKNFLEKCKSDGASHIIDVVHCNSDYETGLPYDFVVKQQCGDVVTEVYIEVKTTVSNSKACFQISLNQLLFAHQHGQSYHLYRVYSAGNPKEASLSKIENLRDKMLQEKVRLMMII